LAEGSVEGAVEGDFVAHHQSERAVGSLEDLGEALVVVLGLEVGCVACLGCVHFVGEQMGLDVGDAAETPAGYGHGFDQIHFDGVGGLKALDVRGQESFVVFLGFGGEDDGLGGEAVAQAVGR